jgi:hypothetical protein
MQLCTSKFVPVEAYLYLQQTNVQVSEAGKIAKKSFRKTEVRIYILVVPVQK